MRSYEILERLENKRLEVYTVYNHLKKEKTMPFPITVMKSDSPYNPMPALVNFTANGIIVALAAGISVFALDRLGFDMTPVGARVIALTDAIGRLGASAALAGILGTVAIAGIVSYAASRR